MSSEDHPTASDAEKAIGSPASAPSQIPTEQDEEKTDLQESGSLAPQHGENKSQASGDVDVPVTKDAAPKKEEVDAEGGVSSVEASATPIPSAQRRGLLGRFTIIPELEDPHLYGSGTKWTMTLIIAFTAALSSTGSAIFYPALALMAEDLHTSKTIANFSIAFYLLIMAFTPLWWSSWSEVLGRRTIYITSFVLFVIFAAISAVSVNVAMLIVFRIMTGGAAAAVQSVGAGSIADLWEPKERGRAVSVFFLGPPCGPGLAPVIGGALAQALGWRSTLWASVVFGGVLLILIVLCLPETTAKRPQGAKPPAKGAALLKERFVDPLKTLKYLQYPPIIVTVWSGGLGFAVLYVILIAIQADFGSPPYSYSTLIVGLLYIPPTLGYAAASQVGGRWIDYLMKRGAKRAGRFNEDGTPIYLPEDRMQENIWLASSLYPLAMIWYGWTVQYGVHWIVPSIANFFFGIGSMLVFSCVTTMLTEFTPKRSASGVALNNFVRQILATIAAVIVQPLINAIGTGWMCTMIALFALVTGNLAILALKTQAPKWRVKMDEKLNRA